VRASKVTAHVDLPGTHDPTGAGRQVHPWAHVLKAVVTPAAPKVVTTTEDVSMVRRLDMVTIAIVLPAHPMVVASNANAINAAPKEVDSSASDSLAREAMASTAIASPVRPIVVTSMASARHVRDSICV
jgi:hypothetical protein